MSDKIFDKKVSITFLGHAGFKLVSPEGINFLIDPWIKDNPQAPVGSENLGPVDYILISHGHADHFGDTVEIANKTGATVISIHEISQYLTLKGFSEEKNVGMNKGGTVIIEETRITMVHAIHSSSITEDDQIIYTGEAAGFVIRFKNGFTVYYAGDTGLFGDMKLIGDIYKPDLAILPIGNHYVMGPEEAVWACEFVKPQYVIPMHFGTFPVFTGTPEKFKDLMKKMPEVKIVIMNPGETIQ